MPELLQVLEAMMNPIEAGARAYDQSSPCEAHTPRPGHYRVREWTCSACKRIRIRAAAIAMVGALLNDVVGRIVEKAMLKCWNASDDPGIVEAVCDADAFRVELIKRLTDE